MIRARRKWYSRLVDLAVLVHGYRPGEDEAARRRRQMSFETDVSRLPLRMTEFLRDRLRAGWLRIRKN